MKLRTVELGDHELLQTIQQLLLADLCFLDINIMGSAEMYTKRLHEKLYAWV
jgi:hypothetical protein